MDPTSVHPQYRFGRQPLIKWFPKESGHRKKPNLRDYELLTLLKVGRVLLASSQIAKTN
jgi:hypothetical protein